VAKAEAVRAYVAANQPESVREIQEASPDDEDVAETIGLPSRDAPVEVQAEAHLNFLILILSSRFVYSFVP